jgi:hypothetical protein
MNFAPFAFQNQFNIPTNGMFLYLDAGNTMSYPLTGSTWYDLSGNDNHGTLTNGPTFSSADGGSIVFDGSNDFIDFASRTNIPTGNPAYTLCFWYSPANVTGGHALVGWGNYGSNLDANAFRTIGNALINYWWANDLTSSALGMSANGWYFGVARYIVGGARTIYMNDVSRGTDTPSTSGRNITTTNNFYVARTNSTEYMNGKISMALCYNRALSLEEMTNIFNQTKGRYGY